MIIKKLIIIFLLIAITSCTPVNQKMNKTTPTYFLKLNTSTSLPPTNSPQPDPTKELSLSTGINKISVSPDGKVLLVTDMTGVWIYNLENSKLIKYQAGDPIIYLPFFYTSLILWSPDGRYVAVSQNGNGIWIWDAATWELVTEIAGDGFHTDYRYDIGNPGFSWSPNSEKLALGLGYGNISVWDSKTNNWDLLEKKIEAKNMQLGVLWTKEDQLTTVMGYDMFDVKTGKKIKDFRTWIDGHGLITWSPDQTHIYFFFDLGGGIVDLNKDFQLNCCNIFSWSESGEFFATFSDYDNSIYVIDTYSNKIISQNPMSDKVYALAWTPSHEILAVIFDHQNLVLKNVNNGYEIMNLNEHIMK